MATLRPVPQKDWYGCGVSAAATILGCSYDKALRVVVATFQNFDACKRRGLLRRELVQLLGGYQLRRGATRVVNFAPGSIVLITVRGETHYLVFDGKQWLDSLDQPLTKAPAQWTTQKTGGRLSRLPRNSVSDLYLAPPE